MKITCKEVIYRDGMEWQINAHLEANGETHYIRYYCGENNLEDVEGQVMEDIGLNHERVMDHLLEAPIDSTEGERDFSDEFLIDWLLEFNHEINDFYDQILETEVTVGQMHADKTFEGPQEGDAWENYVNECIDAVKTEENVVYELCKQLVEERHEDVVAYYLDE